MVTPNLKLYAAPLALLILTVPLAAPEAMADPARNYKAVTAKFSYNPNAPAAEIYADLERTAERACDTRGPRPLGLRKLDAECAANLVDAAVQRIARTDIAAVHHGDTRG